jgi:acetylornithine/N-succinyldiaminopimelate aminotransferase
MEYRKLMETAQKNILYVTDREPVVMTRGLDMYLWDTQGKKYLDFVAGWAVNSLGHCPPVLIKALVRQASRLINASPAYYNDKMIEFADLLVRNSCFQRVFFTSTGAEANEGAIKLARKYGQVSKNGAYKIITFEHSFHGRTLATMSATGKDVWKPLFEPKVPGFVHVPFNDIEAVRAALDAETCAVMIEPIQGEGGVIEVKPDFISALAQLCKETKTLLIFDEIQTGLGRTGDLFSYLKYNVEPDIMTLGKGIGGGYPLAAMLAKEELNIFKKGEQGGTYTNQPLGMAVGLAVTQEIIRKKLWLHARDMGELIKNELATLAQRYRLSDIRGSGLLLAFNVPERKAQEILLCALKNGLLINSPDPSVIRLIPALTLKAEHVHKMIAILEKCLKEVY